jgi:acetyl esterase
MAVGGDSAGGNLAAVVAIDARDRGGPKLTFQVLVYPSTDMRMGYPSLGRYAEQLPLTRVGMQWFIDHYLRSAADKSDWRASPILTPNLKGLPPALVITAGFDPLSDEGAAYAEALRKAGVTVVHERFEGQIHGFISMGRIVADAGRATALAAAALRRAFGMA